MRWIGIIVAVSLGATCPGEALARDQILEFHPFAGQLRTVNIEINGRVARLIFDTGAGLTSLTPEFAATLGCQPRGQVTGFRMDGQRVEFQRCPDLSVRIGNAGLLRELAVFDLNAVLPAGLPQVDGILGLDVLQGRRVTLLAGLAGLRLERGRTRSPEGASEGRMRLATEAGGAGLTVFVAANSDNGGFWLLLDSANLAGVRLHPAAYRALVPETSAVGSDAPVTLRVSGAEPTAVTPTVVSALIYDGALDATFMSAYDITIDLHQERIWWRKRASPLS